MINTQRYESTMPVMMEFVTNANGSGDQLFTQLKRDGNVCLYRRNITDPKGRKNKWKDGMCAGFEVVVIKTVLEGSKLPGGGVVEKTYESYPGAEGFGRRGWFFPPNGEESAVVKFNEMVQKAADKALVIEDDSEDGMDEEPVMMGFVTAKALKVVTPKVVKSAPSVVIPEGEFTQAVFARANGLPERGTVYNVLHSQIKGGLVKESRRERLGGGRPTVLYTKV
jgi:hypothetical protein